MRIGIDAHILGKGKGGVERVVHQMVAHLPDMLPDCHFVVFTDRRRRHDFPSRPNVRFRPLPIANPLVQRSVVLPWLARREHLDLLHVQRAAPPAVAARLVVHIHDLLPLTAPEDHRGLHDRVVRHLTPGSIRRANSVITVSETASAEIRRLFPVAASKTSIVPNGIESDFFRPAGPGELRGDVHRQLDLDRPYALYLGAIAERKNLVVALRGFVAYLSRRPESAGPRPLLVLAGMCRSSAYERQLRTLAAEIAPGLIRFAGFVPEADCLALLQQASVFLAPSRGEGFDLPALEAMACGVPVICSELPIHREILGDDAVFFDTHQPESLGEALFRVTSDLSLRQRLIVAGAARATRFSWPAAMRRLANIYLSLRPVSVA